MLEVGGFRQSLCNGFSRRAFLKAGASLPLALGAANLRGVARAKEEARAKSVIFVWLWGAPSHLDTFDPKPNAPAEYRGPFSTIATRTPGVRFTELLPRLAARSDRYSLIRSNINHSEGHPDAGTVSLTGFLEVPEPVRPNFGSIIARHRGDGVLPSFIGLGRGTPRDVVRPVKGYGGGQWGKSYDPLMIDCRESGEVDIPALKLIDGLSPERLVSRKLLLSEMDQLRRTFDSTAVDQWDRSQQRAFSLLSSSESVRALDLSQEDARTRQAYGQTSFGQSCLLARRLVEAGVPYIQVNWSEYVESITPNTDFGWDTHIYNFTMLPDRHCPIFDRAFSALLDDLHERGLMEDTLVVCMGEFGRTPKINNRAARDHWPRCYFSLWAGGGVQAGRVIGESDPLGEDPLTEPYDPLMVGTTIAELAGLTSQVRAEMDVLTGGRVIDALL